MQRAVVLVLVVAVGLLAAAWLLQRSLIYFPARDTGRVPPGVEEVTLRTADGLELGAWLFEAPGAGGRALLVCNGNAGNRAHRTRLAEALRERGWSVLLFDYRGYGGNPGRPTEQGLLADARAALAWLQERPGVDPDAVAYFGESLGAGVAAGLAAERPPAALVLRSPFTSLADVGRAHYPFLPVGLLLRDRYPVVEHVGAYDGPVLVVSAQADTIVPPEQSARVAEAAGRAQHVTVPTADHNDPALLDGDRFVEAVASFLDEHT